MPRPRDSLFGPIAFAIVAGLFAAGAGYTWWLDGRAAAVTPLTDVRAAPLPEIGPAAPLPTREVAAIARPRTATPPPRRDAPAGVVSRCIGDDGVPIYTSGACPDASRLDRRVAVEVSDPPPHVRSSPPPPAPGASAVAVVNNYVGGSGYGLPSRQERRDYDYERAFAQCERARVRERAELLALGLERKMSHVRHWADHVVQECATLKALERRR